MEKEYTGKCNEMFADYYRKLQPKTVDEDYKKRKYTH